MCNCIDNIKAKVREMSENNKKSNEEISDVTFNSSAIIFGDVVDNKQTSMLQTVSQVGVEKRVTAKSGKVRKRTETLNFVHKYCPFCGEKY
jgi:glucose-6-phosphate isomerase